MKERVEIEGEPGDNMLIGGVNPGEPLAADADEDDGDDDSESSDDDKPKHGKNGKSGKGKGAGSAKQKHEDLEEEAALEAMYSVQCLQRQAM